MGSIRPGDPLQNTGGPQGLSHHSPQKLPPRQKLGPPTEKPAQRQPEVTLCGAGPSFNMAQDSKPKTFTWRRGLGTRDAGKSGAPPSLPVTQPHEDLCFLPPTIGSADLEVLVPKERAVPPLNYKLRLLSGPVSLLWLKDPGGSSHHASRDVSS